MIGEVRIKICGITRPEDALRAAELGVDAIGLNFAPESPRCIDRVTAARILEALPDGIEPVAVFVERSPEQMRATLAGLDRIRTVQLHGPLTPLAPVLRGEGTGVRGALAVAASFQLADAAGQVGNLSPQQDILSPEFRDDACRLIRAFQVRSAESLRLLDEYLAQLDQLPGALLLDGYAPGQHGGTGQTAPWHLLAGYRSSLPIILAGGLRPENVAEAVRIVRPYAVDVASGVESSPGIKDADKMRRFVEAVRNASLAMLAEANPH